MKEKRGLENANLLLLEILIDNAIEQWNGGEYDEDSMRNAMHDLASFMVGKVEVTE